jgi:hypothetical protein
MKKNIAFLILCIFVALAGLLCMNRFCSSGRYRIAFGNIRISQFQVLTPEETGRKYTENKTEYEVVPVCFKIDTLTGKVWIYEDDYSRWADGSAYHTLGFKQIPKYKREKIIGPWKSKND